MYLAVLWIQIRIGSVFRSFLDSDPDPNWAKILDTDPDPNSMYLDPQHCFLCLSQMLLLSIDGGMSGGSTLSRWAQILWRGDYNRMLRLLEGLQVGASS